MIKKTLLTCCFLGSIVLSASAQADAASGSQFQQLLAEKSFDFNALSILRGTVGLVALLFIAWLFSTNRKAISWTTVGKGLLMQFLIAVSVLFIGPVKDFFNFFGSCFVDILDWTKAGSEFLFGSLLSVNTFGFIFAFQILPTIIFFAALTSLLFYLGIIQKIVWVFAWLMTRAIKLSGSESLATVGNIFLGQSESPLMIKPYIGKMTKSEIMLIMTAGMATMAGGVLAAYIRMLGNGDLQLEHEFAKHLLSASVMAAPGAIVVSKILVPQTEEISTIVEVPKEKIGKNVLDSISNGTLEGLKLAANVGAMLLVFYALIAGVNSMLNYVGSISVISLLALVTGVLAGAVNYPLIKPVYKKWAWVFTGILFIICSFCYYIGTKVESNLYDIVSQVNTLIHLDVFGFPLVLGLLIGALAGRSFISNGSGQRISYLATAMGTLLVLFGVMLYFFPNQINFNQIISENIGSQYQQLSLQFILGYVFAPLVWLIGVCKEDMSLVGQLLGQKIILTEFVGYGELSNMLVKGSFLEVKSIVMATYILCGFANFASIGIQIGGIGSLAPNQRALLSSYGLRALLGGTLSALLSATLVGMMI